METWLKGLLCDPIESVSTIVSGEERERERETDLIESDQSDQQVRINVK